METIEATEKHISPYGKVYRTGNKFVENVFLGEVTVQEKIDGCFDYSMRVKLSDGTGLEIGKIVNQQLPVEVLTYNTDTNKVESKKIVNWFRYDHDGEFLKLIVKGRSSSRKNKIIVTKNHMIYTNKGKVEAETLKVGDTVIGMSLFETEILDIETINNNSSCKFDIEVEDNHNYYCGNILVSNSQFSWCRGDNGDTLFRSRNVQMDNTTFEQMFERGIVALHEIHDSFNPDFIYRGNI